MGVSRNLIQVLYFAVFFLSIGQLIQQKLAGQLMRFSSWVTAFGALAMVFALALLTTDRPQTAVENTLFVGIGLALLAIAIATLLMPAPITRRQAMRLSGGPKKPRDPSKPPKKNKKPA